MLRTKVILSYDICWVCLFHCIHVIFLLLGVLPNTGRLPSDSRGSGGIWMEPGDKTSFSKTAPAMLVINCQPSRLCLLLSLPAPPKFAEFRWFHSRWCEKQLQPATSPWFPQKSEQVLRPGSLLFHLGIRNGNSGNCNSADIYCAPTICKALW